MIAILPTIGYNMLNFIPETPALLQQSGARVTFREATVQDSTTPSKRCANCLQDYPATAVNFPAYTDTSDGLFPCCISCYPIVVGDLATLEKMWRVYGYFQNDIAISESFKAKEQLRKDKEDRKVVRERISKNIRDKKSEVAKRRRERETQKRIFLKAQELSKDTEDVLDLNGVYQEFFKENFGCATVEDSSDPSVDSLLYSWLLNRPERIIPKNPFGSVRKFRILTLPNTFTDTDWERCLAYWQHRCAVCGRPAGLFHLLARDHWIPLSSKKSGNPGTVPTNIVPLCHGLGGCNNKKRYFDPHQWLEQTLGKSKAQEIENRIAEYFNFIEAVK